MNLKQINNLTELFFNQFNQQTNKDKILLSTLDDKKKNYSWQETFDFINLVSSELRNLISKGDRCLLISENRPEWFITDLSIMLSDGITVPAYTTYAESDYDYILNDCTPSIIFVSNTEQFNKLKNIIKDKKFIKKIFSFEKLINSEIEYINLEDLIQNSNKKNLSIHKSLASRKDPSCIIYTSGTEGRPKGVILSHGGILSNCEGAVDILKPLLSKEQPRFLTWLPLSHSYEHTVQFVQITVAARIFYAESIDKLVKNMNECSPEIMTAVPRFYQNLYQKINASFRKATGLKKKLISKMLELGLKRMKKVNLTVLEKIQDGILEKLVRNKIKSQFGGSLKTFVSGGGALDKEVGYFLNAIGLPTLQGYGLTETSPVVSCNPIDDIRIDTVGPPFKGNEVKIAEDGEILVKGENVMLGYWNNKKETEKVLIDDWLHTGDIGVLENNFLKITDRKKDILITPGGENISPLKIENELVNLEFIDQAVVYGDNKPYLVALLVLNDEFINITNDEIHTVINNLNSNLSKIENIKKFFLIKEKFSIENGMLTPTLKLKRYKIINKYKFNFENLYN
ncbi:long-chain fatty acid--CoA ligase [Candidatus Pelagibacter sp.]|nr:long-chain fatty acid--CoA ligase [Candidatus Pelagibacter sp.]